MHSPLSLALALALSLPAGANDVYTPDAAGYDARARLMLQCADYAGAADQLMRARELSLQPEADLALLQALLMNGETDAMRNLCADFLSHFEGTPQAVGAEALLADSYFFEGDWREALSRYRNNLPLGTLPSPAMEGAQFRMALSMLQLDMLDEAREEFAKLSLREGYNGISRFYLAYIAYRKEDYGRALLDFRALPKDIAEQTGTDFYIAQILFKGGRYAEVLGMERELMAAANRISTPERHSLSEAYRLLGESAYATGDTRRGVDLLRRHVSSHPEGGELSARYILGITDYAEGNYTAAMDMLQPVSRSNDAMGQSASLYLGQSAAKLGDWSAAAMGFDRAARMDFDSKVSETALYNYAAAVTNGGNVPFGSATSLLEEFISKYPKSTHAAAVEEYLAVGYYREHRYKEALEKINRINRPSDSVLQLKQRALFDQGADLLAAGRATEARPYLQQAAGMSSVKELVPAARLWYADCLYKLKDYRGAVTAYDSYLTAAQRTDANRSVGEYNRAYALFQSGNYTSARTGFERALAGNLTGELKADATLRVADCLNFSGKVNEALATYNRAASMPSNTATDYALFQSANMLGVLGRTSDKIAMLNRLLNERKESSWCSAALAELAEAQQASGDIAAARATIARMERDYPDSEQLRVASLSLADALADKGKTSEAIDAYEQLIRRWPTSPQAKVASENLQGICTEQGELERYLSFINSVPGAPRPDAEKVAQLSYQAAMNAVERNPRDLAPLEKFVAEYPASTHTPDALAELADDYMALNDYDKALSAANRILTSYPHSQGVPSALIIKGRIETERGNKAQAREAYALLLTNYGTAYARQAYEGLMRNATSPAEAIDYAGRFLSLPDVSATDRDAAVLLRARAYMEAGNQSAALQDYQSLAGAPRTAVGGEATVSMAEIYLKQNRAAEAEKLMSKFTEGGCEDMYWLARGYIALADAYAAQGRKTLAREYLQALRENYPQAGSEIKNAINQRLNQWK
ncbi:MAG: tetratricopeptide repeat protein [Bacteroidales bacterium]|nr:tetratricopeptide repeat protein [Bacteroidales bacterium]